MVNVDNCIEMCNQFDALCDIHLACRRSGGMPNDSLNENRCIESVDRYKEANKML